MSENDDELFSVATNAELRARGVTAESWRPYQLNPENVPAGLRDLVPLAQRFGIGCDVTRHDFAEKMTTSDREALRAGLARRHGDIEDFLYSSPPSWRPSPGTTSIEEHAFSAMLV